jgi:hypothetical protein
MSKREPKTISSPDSELQTKSKTKSKTKSETKSKTKPNVKKDVISDKTYWIKITCDEDTKDKRKSDKLHLTDVSADFIRGIYCGLNDPFENCSYDDNDIHLESNFPLEGCLSADTMASWGDGNYFEDFCGLDIDDEGNPISNDNDDNDDNNHDKQVVYRKKILNNSKKYNERWQKFMKEHSDELTIKKPTKRYFACIQTGDNSHMIQFDSVDFLNGFETMRLWTDSIPYWFYSLYLYSVFDSNKVCRTSVTYIHKSIPDEKHKKNKSCDNNKNCEGYNKNGHNTYDECLTPITVPKSSSCHIHEVRPSHKIKKLKNCLAQIKLEKL